MFNIPKPTKQDYAYYLNRADNLVGIAQDEGFEIEYDKIHFEKYWCKNRLKIMTHLAMLYKAWYCAKSQHPCSWTAAVEFLKVMLQHDLESEIRSYRYYIVYGIGDRSVDNPFEQGDETINICRNLIQYCESKDQNLLINVRKSLGDKFIDKYRSILSAWRKQYPLYLESRKPITNLERRLTAKEVDSICNLNLSVQPNTRNWWIRMPTLEERVQQALPLDVANLVYRDSHGEGATWHIAIDNPEMLTFTFQTENVPIADPSQLALI